MSDLSDNSCMNPSNPPNHPPNHPLDNPLGPTLSPTYPDHPTRQDNELMALLDRVAARDEAALKALYDLTSGKL